jgi:outer membrane protein assembly factor BamD (BamD/ComL family)
MVRMAGPLMLAAALAAPFQCGSRARPENHLEEEPADALYKLAERFAVAGDPKARAETLRFLVERYPSSRFAEAARLDLEQLGKAPR